VQTNMWGRYRVTDPDDFFNRVGAWTVARDPETPEATTATGATTTTNADASPSEQDRIDPYYLLTSLPGQEDEAFVQLRPFTPIRGDTRPVLTGFLTASSDPDSYGQLISYETAPTSQVDGPSVVAGQIRSFEQVSQDQTQLCRAGSGSTCEFGNLVFVPIEQGIIYVQPLYITAEGTQFPVLRKVIVEFNGQVGYADTLRDALLQIFDEVPETLEDNPNQPSDGGTGSEQPQPPSVDPGVLLDQAQQLFDEAEAALQEGGVAAFGEYADKIEQARALIQQAQAILTGESPPASTDTSSTSTTTTTTPASTTSTTEADSA
jgi:uncharacterized membrane protein (UPF0182 family)